jgi:hypothetical protein
MKGGAEQQLLEFLLKQFKERGWLNERGKQRTDSTHVEAAICTLKYPKPCSRTSISLMLVGVDATLLVTSRKQYGVA